MNIGIVGCGYVAEFYGKTLANYSDLKLVAACDTNAKNLQSFCRRWSAQPYDRLESMLGDSAVELVLNLTNPRSHFDVTKRCIESGKHVYSEKPLAMEATRARELVELAAQFNVYLGSAPCSVLGETAQTVWKALRDDKIGKVRLVYANFDDGMIAPNLAPWLWTNESEVAWPAKDEFEVGCTYEHAGYLLTWLAAFFGPAKKVTSFASCLIRDKGIVVDRMAPDLTVGCIEYASGVVARLTCSLVAPEDKSLTIIGDKGIISVSNVRNDACSVYLRSVPSAGWRAGAERRINRMRALLHVRGWERDWHFWTRIPLVRKAPPYFVDKGKPVDFCRGPAEMAAAIRERRPCRLSPEMGWHIAELVEHLQYPERFEGQTNLVSTFEPCQPLPIAT